MTPHLEQGFRVDGDGIITSDRIQLPELVELVSFHPSPLICDRMNLEKIGTSCFMGWNASHD